MSPPSTVNRRVPVGAGMLTPMPLLSTTIPFRRVPVEAGMLTPEGYLQKLLIPSTKSYRDSVLWAKVTRHVG